MTTGIVHHCDIPGCRDPRWHAGMRRDQLGPTDPGKDHRLGVYCVPDGYLAPGIAPALDLSIGWKLSAGQDDAPNLDMSDAFIVLEYGSGDGADDNLVEIDLLRGTCVSVPARSVIAKLVYTAQDNPNNQFIQPVLDVSISVAFGAASSSGGVRPPRRTVKMGDITVAQAPVESGVFKIPPFSHSAILMTADVTTSLTIKWYTQDEPGAVAGNAILIETNVIGKLDRDSVPVPDGARGFTLTTGNTTVTRAAVIFLVAPG